MCRSPRRVPAGLWVLPVVMTLLSLMLPAAASADTVTPARHCTHGDRYVELDGERSVVATAPDGYLIASFCVDSGGRHSRSEVHTLSTPQPSTVVRRSDGRWMEGYSVTYVEDSEDEAGDGDDGAGNESDGDGESGQPGEEQSPTAEETEKPGRTQAVPETTPEPTPSALVEVTEQPEHPSQMTALSDGEELRITSLDDDSDDDDENLRAVVVAGSIILLGLLAGAVALLVRLPGQR